MTDAGALQDVLVKVDETYVIDSQRDVKCTVENRDGMEKVPQSAGYPMRNTVFVLQPTGMSTCLPCVSAGQNLQELILSMHLALTLSLNPYFSAMAHPPTTNSLPRWIVKRLI